MNEIDRKMKENNTKSPLSKDRQDEDLTTIKIEKRNHLNKNGKIQEYKTYKQYKE